MSASEPTASDVPTWLSFARLVRLPNLFSAPPDVLAGYGLVVAGLPIADQPFPLVFWGALAASVLLYASGMIWNDYFDLEEDREDRPFRPVASGAVGVHIALTLGLISMGAGIAIAWITDFQVGVVATALAFTILLYDGAFKNWFFAPVLMGLCRALNFALGAQAAMSLTNVAPEYSLIEIAGWANGIYIVGVTVFASQETGQSSRRVLGIGLTLMGVGLLAHAFQWTSHHVWTPILVVLALLILFDLGISAGHALREPSPHAVQLGVKYGIWGLVLLNAGNAIAFWNIEAGIVILLHIFVMDRLGRWVYST